jgi:uncharacterized membrane-anchored protein
MSIKDWLKKDKLSLGFLIGLVIPLPVAVLFALILRLIQLNFHILANTRITDLLLLGVGVNLLIMRYYIVKLKCENTAKGLIIVSFIIILLFFLFLKNSTLTLPF